MTLVGLREIHDYQKILHKSADTFMKITYICTRASELKNLGYVRDQQILHATARRILFSYAVASRDPNATGPVSNYPPPILLSYTPRLTLVNPKLRRDCHRGYFGYNFVQKFKS